MKIKKVNKDVLAILYLLGVSVFFFNPIFFNNMVLSSSDFLFNWAPWYSLRPEGYSGPTNHTLTDPIDMISGAIWLQGKNFVELFNLYKTDVAWGQPSPSMMGSSYSNDFTFFIFLKVFSVGTAISLYSVFKVFLAGLGMYFLTKVLTKNFYIALLTSSAYMISSSMIGILFWPHSLIYAILPIMFLSVIKLSEKFEVRYFLLLWLSGFQIFIGSFPVLIVFSYALPLFLYFILAFKKQNLKTISLFYLFIFLLILSISIFILPNLTNYQAMDLGYRTGTGFKKHSLSHLFQILYPNFCGNHTTIPWSCSSNWYETASYSGLIPLLLILSGVFLKSKLWKVKYYILFALILQTSILFNFFNLTQFFGKLPILGQNSLTRLSMTLPFYTVLLGGICLFDVLNYIKTSRKNFFNYFLFLILSILILFSYIYFTSLKELLLKNIDLLNSDILSYDGYLLLAIFATFTFCLIIFKLTKYNSILILLSLVTVFELYHFNKSFNPYIEKQNFMPTPNSVSYIQKNIKQSERVLEIGRVFLPNASSYYNVNSLIGHNFRTKGFTEMMQLIDPNIYTGGHGTLGFFNRSSIELYSKGIKELLEFNRVKYILFHPSSESLKVEVHKKQKHYRNFKSLKELGEYSIYNKNKKPIKINGITLFLNPYKEITKDSINIRHLNKSLNLKYQIRNGFHAFLFDEIILNEGDSIQISTSDEKVKTAYFPLYDIDKTADFTSDNAGDIFYALYYKHPKLKYLKTQFTKEMKVVEVLGDTKHAYFFPCSSKYIDCNTNSFYISSSNFLKALEDSRKVLISNYKDGEITLKSNKLKDNGFILLADNYYNGWHNQYDEIVKSGPFNTIATKFNAKTMTEDLTLKYINPYLKLGAIISSISAFLIFIFLFRISKTNRDLLN